ncbi:hypothetical protein Acor_58240 [Acrocarpospora corrugata]|uniref:Transposase IS110-like N-terminal domain-containing protein n=1 Tax=Acrocarpospora corrugata TaxID=35763 RepID=A0A5M3WBB1_9ACTN|nr:hypothetical protein Acor_58240 [Acrocarpospora corrugata]
MSVDYAVFVGLDVGKGEHHACALDPRGKKLYDKPLPNDEQRLRALFGNSKATGRCSSWSISPPPSAPCPSRSPAPKAARSPTCRA